MKKLIALLLVGACMLGGLVSCTGAPAPAVAQTNEPQQTVLPALEKSEAPVELTLVTSFGGDDAGRIPLENALAAFQEATGHTVLNHSATSNEEWKAEVIESFAAGSEPDVLFFFTERDADGITKDGKFVSIAEIREDFPDYATHMKEDMLTPSLVDGKKYFVPLYGFWESLFANKNVLSAAGVDVPGPDYSWDTFLADCEKIKAAGYTPIAVSLNEVPHYWFEFSIYNNGTTANHLDVPKSVDDAVAQKWKKGFEDLTLLYERGYLPPDTLTATDAETMQRFREDNAAFVLDGSWTANGFARDYAQLLDHIVLTYVPAKGSRKATDIIGGFSMGYFITRKAWDDPSKRQACVDLVTTLSSPDNIALLAGTGATALKSPLPAAGASNPLFESVYKVTGNASSIVMPLQDKTLDANARLDLFGNIKHVVSGQMSFEDALQSYLDKVG